MKHRILSWVGLIVLWGGLAVAEEKEKNNAGEVKLSETIDKKALKPGTYLMNVVAHNATSRVVFTVSEKKGDVKLPDLKKIVDFLRKKK